MKLYEKLKDLREQKNMTQMDLAEATGIPKRSIQYYESGKGYPRRKQYPILANALGVDTNYLMTEDEEFIADAGEEFGPRGQLQAQEILAQASALFAGGELSEEDKKAFMHDMQDIFFDAKERAREKFTPKQYRK
jgi:transcriptional regulator with XRE-family HTH domain